MKNVNLQRLILSALAIAFSLSITAADARQPIITGGIEIFYGVMPSSVLLAHPGDHTERTMHGGAKGTRDEYHLLVSIFDARNKRRITDAQLKATVQRTGSAPQTKSLESMQMTGVLAYGNFFTMNIPGSFFITLDITRPGSLPVTRATFEYVNR